jgi:hypothetical protein
VIPPAHGETFAVMPARREWDSLIANVIAWQRPNRGLPVLRR